MGMFINVLSLIAAATESISTMPSLNVRVIKLNIDNVYELEGEKEVAVNMEYTIVNGGEGSVNGVSFTLPPSYEGEMEVDTDNEETKEFVKKTVDKHFHK